jgi:hypothetical protein
MTGMKVISVSLPPSWVAKYGRTLTKTKREFDAVDIRVLADNDVIPEAGYHIEGT